MMDDIIDKVVAESNDNLEEIVKVASQLVGSHDSQDNKQLAGDDDGLTNASMRRVMQMPMSSEEDNMDYDSDDDDDSKSNNSSSNNRSSSSNKKRLKGEVKRSHHNVLERKRRDLIKDSFTKLKEAVPTLSIERASRAQILKRAADFIQAQHQRNESTRADIKDLIKKNADLESKINSRIQVKKEQD